MSKHQHLLFFRFRLEKYNFLLKKKDFCWLNSAFSLHFISDFIPLDPDPRTQMNPDPHRSGSASLVIKMVYLGLV